MHYRIAAPSKLGVSTAIVPVSSYPPNTLVFQRRYASVELLTAHALGSSEHRVYALSSALPPLHGPHDDDFDSNAGEVHERPRNEPPEQREPEDTCLFDAKLQ